MKALILAGGSGKRLMSNSQGPNKCMLQFFDKPLVEYSLENAVKAGVEEIVLVVGYRAEEIINEFGNCYQDVKIKYVIQYDPKGLVHAIDCSRSTIGNSDFMLFLADEILRDPRHPEMIEQFYSEELFVVCGVVEEPDVDKIRKTYAVIQDDRDRRIYRLIEKPRKPHNNIRGTGNCVFRAGIIEYLDLTPVNQSRGEKELPDLIQCAIDDGHKVKAFDIGNAYVNINTPEDIEIAEKTYETKLSWTGDAGGVAKASTV